MQLDPDKIQTGSATYCPEDNKLRLYVGRVPRPEYDALRAEGWTATPKQDCQFVAHWTPERRDTALAYGEGEIGDEDQSPADRAADRAERFGGYRDKRTDEATGHADRYDAGPAAHGFQSQARADRAVVRHDRIANRAGDSWSKAEYWTQRTAGVISHALHVSAPSVRMGRIKELEAEIRKAEKGRAEYAERFALWKDCAAMTDPIVQAKRVELLAGSDSGCYSYKHPRPEQVKNAHIRENGSSLWTLLRMSDGEYGEPITAAEAIALYFSKHGEPADEGPWLTHYRLRLAYENQMIEAQGGRAGVIEMIPGGWLIGGGRTRRQIGTGGERRIVKVNKSPTTGRVVSVLVRDNHASHVNHWGNPFPDGVAHVLSHTIEIERAGPDCYRAPTPEELAEFEAGEKAAKKARKETGPAPIPLINPTDAEAERLQAIWNQQNASALASWHRGEPAPTVARITQAQYSAASSGAYSKCETIEITGGGFQRDSGGCMRSTDCPTVAKVRAWGYRVVILSDKPQKAFAANVWHDPRPALIEELAGEFVALEEATRAARLPDASTDAGKLLRRAETVRLAYISSMCQFGWTDAGKLWAKEQRAKIEAAPAFALESETANA